MEAAAEEQLLDILRRAGAKGSTPATLRLEKAARGAAGRPMPRRAALEALVRDGRVQSLGAGKTPRFVLAEHLPTAGSVAARLLTLHRSGEPPALWKRTNFNTKLPAHERSLLDAALDHLQKTRQLLALRQGPTVFFAFAEPLREWLGVGPSTPSVEEAATRPLDLPAIYRRLVRESGGFPDVKIAALAAAIGPTASGALQSELVARWREGRATLSLGDWSLASEETRAAAVELDGEKYLLVRLDDASESAQ